MLSARTCRLLTRLGPYALTLAITVVLSLWFYMPWRIGATDVFGGGEDIVGVQANIVAAGQAGPFGTDPHLAWPVGYDMWSFPQLGMGALVLVWFLAGPLGVGSGSTELILMTVAMASTGLSALFFLRSVIGPRLPVLAAVLASAVGLSPFFAGSVGHVNVALFGIVPVSFAILMRGRGRGARWWLGASAVLAVLAAISPLWWALVAPMVLAILGLGHLLRREVGSLARAACAVGGIAIGLAIQGLLYWQARVPGAPTGRGAWDANWWGGRMTDLLVSSPFLNLILPGETLASLKHGSSLEFNALGTVCALAFVGAFLLLIKGMAMRIQVNGSGRVETGILSLVTAVAILFYLAGGLGNAQAGLAVILGGASPARTWSRMSILIAICGIAWFLAYAARWVAAEGRRGVARRWGPAAAVVLVGCLAVIDLAATPRPSVVAATDLPEHAAVRFIEGSTTPCPIAQLPQDGAPEPRAASPKEVFYYRGYYSFLLAPNWYWSLGSWVPGKPSAMSDVGPVLTVDGQARLESAGYCAVMYDKWLADLSRRDGLGLEASEVRDLPSPDFVSERYDVYLLGSKRPRSG